MLALPRPTLGQRPSKDASSECLAPGQLCVRSSLQLAPTLHEVIHVSQTCHRESRVQWKDPRRDPSFNFRFPILRIWWSGTVDGDRGGPDGARTTSCCTFSCWCSLGSLVVGPIMILERRASSWFPVLSYASCWACNTRKVLLLRACTRFMASTLAFSTIYGRQIFSFFRDIDRDTTEISRPAIRIVSLHSPSTVMLKLTQTLLLLLAVSIPHGVHGQSNSTNSTTHSPGVSGHGAHCVTGATYCGYILLEHQGS